MKTTSLTLSRREGEALIVDHDIRITVTEIKGKQARINVTAPEDVDVIREEFDGVWEVEEDNKE